MTVYLQVKQSVDWERRFDNMQQHSGKNATKMVSCVCM